MSFRGRLLLGFGAVALVPLIVFGLRVRTAMADRLTAAYQQRVAALVSVIRIDLERQSAGIAERLDALKNAIAADNRFRVAALQGGERAYLLDYAGDAMRLTGLAMLQIQDEQGRLLSSGHFRNEYDRPEAELPRLLAAAGGTALVEARTAEAPFLALARVDALRLGGRRFTLVGGIAVDSSFVARLAPDSELAVAVVIPPDTAPRPDAATEVVSTLIRPFVAAGDSARLLEGARRGDAVARIARGVAPRRGAVVSHGRGRSPGRSRSTRASRRSRTTSASRSKAPDAWCRRRVPTGPRWQSTAPTGRRRATSPASKLGRRMPRSRPSI